MRRGGEDVIGCAASVPAPTSLGDASASSIGSMSAIRCIWRVMLQGDCLAPPPLPPAAAAAAAVTTVDGGDNDEEGADVACALTQRPALLSGNCSGSSADEESSSVSLVGVGGNAPARLRRFAAEESIATPRDRGRFAARSAAGGEMESDSAPPLRHDGDLVVPVAGGAPSPPASAGGASTSVNIIESSRRARFGELRRLPIGSASNLRLLMNSTLHTMSCVHREKKKWRLDIIAMSQKKV